MFISQRFIFQSLRIGSGKKQIQTKTFPQLSNFPTLSLSVANSNLYIINSAYSLSPIHRYFSSKSSTPKETNHHNNVNTKNEYTEGITTAETSSTTLDDVNNNSIDKIPNNALSPELRKVFAEHIDKLVEIYLGDIHFTYDSFFNGTYRGNNPPPSQEQRLIDAAYTTDLLKLSNRLTDPKEIITEADIQILNRFVMMMDDEPEEEDDDDDTK